MKTKTFLTIVVVLVLIAFVSNYFYKKANTFLTEGQAADIAANAVIADGRQNLLKYECTDVFVRERKAHALLLGIYERHGGTCGGNIDTEPHITDVVVSLETGEVYDQPATFDALDKNWRTVIIGGWEQYVSKQLSEASTTAREKEVRIFPK